MLHHRQFLARTGLEVSPPQGDTWVARGSSSAIDFFLFRIFRLPRTEVQFWKREDLRIALPSDHNAVGMTLSLQGVSGPKLRRRQRSTLCGKWGMSAEATLRLIM